MKIPAPVSPKDFWPQMTPQPAAPTDLRGCLEWVKGAAGAVTSSSFTLLGRKYAHYMVKAQPDGVAVVGHGRDVNPELALTKAFGEIFDRLTAKLIFAEGAAGVDFVRAKWTAQGVQPGGSDSAELPPKSFWTTNGWAVHPQLNLAVRNALHESVERHSLQLLYWRKGLSGFSLCHTREEQNCTFYCLAAPSDFVGLTLIVSAVSHPSYPGLVFGHQAVERSFADVVSSRDVSLWNHAMVEGFQLAESCRQYEVSSDPMDEVNYRFAKSASLNKDFAAGGLDIRQQEELSFSVAAFDLAPMLHLKHPLYAAWVLSDSLVPIYLDRITGLTDKEWLTRRIQRLDPTIDSIEQTPFI